MARKSKKVQEDKDNILAKQEFVSMPVVNLNAVGINIGWKTHFVCIAQNNVKEFKAFTEDLHLIAKYLEYQKQRLLQ